MKSKQNIIFAFFLILIYIREHKLQSFSNQNKKDILLSYLNSQKYEEYSIDFYNQILNNELNSNNKNVTNLKINDSLSSSSSSLKFDSDQINQLFNSNNNQESKLVSKVFFCIIFLIICFTCIFGNILVVLSVFTYRPLQSVQNIFIVSLALADTFVAAFVMPFHITYHITEGKWIFGTFTCHFFLTLDILLCTSSILHLCCIALDRYWAIKDSIKYAQKRTMKRVLIMILIAWLSSALTSLPVIIWNMKTVRRLNTSNDLNSNYINQVDILNSTITKLIDRGGGEEEDEEEEVIVCDIPRDKLYRFYSASGTFYLPLLIMTFVYVRIYLETKRRLRERAEAVKKLAKSMANSSGMTGDNNQNKNKKNSKKIINLNNKHHHNIMSIFCNKCLTSNNNQMNVSSNSNISSNNNKNNNNNNNNNNNKAKKKLRNVKINETFNREENIAMTINEESTSESIDKNSSNKFGDILTNSNNSNNSKSDNHLTLAKLSIREESSISLFKSVNESEESEKCAKKDADSDQSSSKNFQTKKSSNKDSNLDRLEIEECLNSECLEFDNERLYEDKVKKVSIGINTEAKKNQMVILSDVDSKTRNVNSSTWTRATAVNSGLSLKQRQKISLTRERKAARTLGIIMGAFTICWLPFFILYLLQSFDLFLDNPGLFELLTWLGYVNSALNPIIYTIFNLDFRKSFERILFNCILCKRR